MNLSEASLHAEEESINDLRQRLRRRRKAHRRILWDEVERLTNAAAKLGARRVILFGSLLREEPGLTTDIDLFIVWETPLSFMDRTIEVYRRLQPLVATDLLVYTPEEVDRMTETPFVRQILREGRVLYEA